MYRTQYFINYITTKLHTLIEAAEAINTDDLVDIIEIHRTDSFDELDEIAQLKERNKILRDKLTKKYRHVFQLMKRIQHLESRVMVSQSGTMGDTAPPEGSAERLVAPLTTQQITKFADEDAGWVTEKLGTYEPTMDMATTNDGELGNFLQRPIRQSAQSWVVGQPFFYKFNPWQTFCENPYVRDKIKNYELLRMKMHVKIVISGTKFHYGRAMCSYNPYTDGDELTKERSFISQDLIQASQKPHFFLNPTSNSGGEMTLPFFWPENYLRIPQGDWDKMGSMTINSFGNLLHANLGNDPVTVTIYIWASDVVLTIPTSSDPPVIEPLPSQSGRRSEADEKNNIAKQDEYGSGIISKPAAAIAKAAGALSDLPAIGPYMTATQIGATALSKTARLFGYSRPTVVTDIIQQKPAPTGNLANTDAADAALKLTLDSKAELTVDSRTVGLDGTDEMGILDYVKRESYLTSFSWAPGDPVDSLLWNVRNLPMLYDSVQQELHMTPLAHMATAFEQWQGSIKYRFQVVKSDYHKGRLLARWDPNTPSAVVNYNTAYSRVIDIAETDDFEIVVGWGVHSPWKKCGQPEWPDLNFAEGARIFANADEGNGVLVLDVLNPLVSPSADSPITINVYVSACDDFKFAGPTNNKLNDFHLFPAPGMGRESPEDEEGKRLGKLEVLDSQSSSPTIVTSDSMQTDKPTSAGMSMELANKGSQADNTYMVFYGDPPTSIRELCKRYCFTRYWVPEKPADDQIQVSVLKNKNMPYYTGYDPNGLDLVPANNRKLTTGPTAFVSWFTPCYAGFRGAMRRKYIFDGAGSEQAPLVSRDGFSTSGNGVHTYVDFILAASPPKVQKFMSAQYGNFAGGGYAATNLGVNNTIEVELPYYMPKRFSKARTIGIQDIDSNSHAVTTTGLSPGLAGRRWGITYSEHVATGEDFSLFFFTGVPIYYNYVADENSS